MAKASTEVRESLRSENGNRPHPEAQRGLEPVTSKTEPIYTRCSHIVSSKGLASKYLQFLQTENDWLVRQEVSQKAPPTAQEWAKLHLSNIQKRPQNACSAYHMFLIAPMSILNMNFVQGDDGMSNDG